MGRQKSSDFVELEFTLADDDYPEVRISKALDCRLDLLDAVHAEDGTVTAFFHVDSSDADSIVEHGHESQLGDEVAVMEQFDDECTVAMVIARCILGTLANARVPLKSLVVSDGTAHFVATVSSEQDAGAVVDAVRDQHPTVEFVGKRSTTTAEPYRTRSTFQDVVDDHLTDRQVEALRSAYENGYFERPRRITQQQLAERMDVTPSTFGQHLNAAMQKLLATTFPDDRGS